MSTRVKQQWLYRVDVTVTDEEMAKMTAWCETNASGEWRVHTRFIDYFQFEKDTDAMMFMLKFGGMKAL
jgi:hypothetical protein